MIRKIRISLLLASTVLLGLSCVRFVGPEEIRHDLSDQAGVKLKQETGLTLTRSAVWLARKFVDQDDFTLEGVRRIEVGVYEVKGLKGRRESPSPLDLTRLEGWEPVVRVNEPGEDVIVLIKEKDEVVRALLVVVAEQDEWVLVRIRGKLNRVLEEAMEMAFKDADRPDLYAKTRRERGLDPPVDDVEPTETGEETAALISRP
jgi:hypothetical protein